MQNEKDGEAFPELRLPLEYPLPVAVRIYGQRLWSLVAFMVVGSLFFVVAYLVVQFSPWSYPFMLGSFTTIGAELIGRYLLGQSPTLILARRIRALPRRFKRAVQSGLRDEPMVG